MADPAWTQLAIFVSVVLFVLACAATLYQRLRKRDPLMRWWNRARRHPSVAVGGGGWQERPDCIDRLTYSVTAISAPGRTEARKRWTWDISDDL